MRVCFRIFNICTIFTCLSLHLGYDSPMNPYYKFLVQSIKDGTYKPNAIENKQSNQQQTSESEDEGYLHPSLLSSNRLKQEPSSYNSPVNNCFKSSTNSLYSKLAENLKDKIVVNEKTCNEPKVIESKAVRYDLMNKNDKNEANQTKVLKQSKSTASVKSVFELMPEIPAEIKLIIEKLAQYVSKNGNEFEQSIRSRNESRFEFLNPGHKFHFYYVKTKLDLLEKKRKQDRHHHSSSASIKKRIEQINAQSNLSENSNSTSDSDLVNSKGIQPFVISAKKQTTSFKDDLEAKQLKEKQEERKRKAALFLNKLKLQNNNPDAESSTVKEESTNQIIGPQLPSDQKRERLRNTPSPLKEFFNDLDMKSDKECKQRHLFDALDEFKNSPTPERDQTSFKSSSRIAKQFRARSSSSKSDDEDKKIDRSSLSSTKRRRSSSRESGYSIERDRRRRSPLRRSSRSPFRRSRSRSSSRRRRKIPHRSSDRKSSRDKSRERRRRSKDRHRDRSRDRKKHRSCERRIS